MEREKHERKGEESSSNGGRLKRRWWSRREANLKVRMMRMHCLTSVHCATGKLEMCKDKIVC